MLSTLYVARLAASSNVINFCRFSGINVRKIYRQHTRFSSVTGHPYTPQQQLKLAPVTVAHFHNRIYLPDAMSSLKRSLDEASDGVSPAKICRVLHTSTATGTVVDEVAQEREPSVNTTADASNGHYSSKINRTVQDGCVPKEDTPLNTIVSTENEVSVPEFSSLSKEEKYKIRMKIKYRQKDQEAALEKEAVKNLCNLLDTESEQKKKLRSDATTFDRAVEITHQDAPAINIDPRPVDPLEQQDIDDGLYVEKRKKRMFAVLLSYSGKGYHGLQNNPGCETIEGELLKTLQSTKLLTANECIKLQTVNFQRAARTDKGVSAARQVISVKLPIGDGEEQHYKSSLNSLLPPQIRVMDIRRAIRSFNSKNWCDFRTYSYLTPTYAFAPLEIITNKEFRISADQLDKLRKLFNSYEGTMNFHNFTVKKKPTEANAKRFIHSMTVDDPFVRENVEWVLIKVRGQSFMMHQIRKMVGLVIAISRGLIPPSTILLSLTHTKVETPKAPGLGLVLEQPHYDVYNKRFGDDGHHMSMSWDDLETNVEDFRREFIDRDIIETELAEDSMMEFLKVIHLYSFTGDSPGSAVGRAYRLAVEAAQGRDESSVPEGGEEVGTAEGTPSAAEGVEEGTGEGTPSAADQGTLVGTGEVTSSAAEEVEEGTREGTTTELTDATVEESSIVVPDETSVEESRGMELETTADAIETAIEPSENAGEIATETEQEAIIETESEEAKGESKEKEDILAHEDERQQS